MINAQSMPFGVQPKHVRYKRVTTTANGAFDTSFEVKMKELVQMLEFVNGSRIKGISAKIFDSPY
eukprot:jgi/Psemu1/186376/e_gw1.57.48.1